MATNPIDAEIVGIVPVQDTGVVLMPVMNMAAARQRLAEFQEFVKEYLVKGEDYGIIPGTPKPTLLKPGADKLTEIYGLSDDYIILKEVENFSAEPPLFDYTIKCVLKTRRDERFVGSGLGSCNSWEGKYRYRQANRKCPLCSKEAIIKGKEEYGGGWVCFKKKDGCGAKFPDGDKSIEGQEAGKVANDDICTLKNTILKMAKKRAKIDAVIAVTRSSGIFTQDVEDIVDHDTSDGSGTRAAAKREGDRKIEELKAKKAQRDPAKAPDQLCCYPAGDAYEVTGMPEVMNNHIELLRAYGKITSKQPPIVTMTAEGLDAFKHEFTDNRGGILVSLKAKKAAEAAKALAEA